MRDSEWFGMAVIIAGDTKVVSSGVARSLDRIRCVDKVTRWAGTGAIGTSVAVANGATKRGWATYGFSGAVDWRSYSDGLSASSAIGSKRGLLVMVEKAAVPAATRTLLSAHRLAVVLLRVFARPSTVGDPVLGSMRTVVD